MLSNLDRSKHAFLQKTPPDHVSRAVSVARKTPADRRSSIVAYAPEVQLLPVGKTATHMDKTCTMNAMSCMACPNVLHGVACVVALSLFNIPNHRCLSNACVVHAKTHNSAKWDRTPWMRTSPCHAWESLAPEFSDFRNSLYQELESTCSGPAAVLQEPRPPLRWKARPPNR